jgi:gliding motility-associated-like protein
MKKKFSCIGIFLICLCSFQLLWSKESICRNTDPNTALLVSSTIEKNTLANVAPYLTATGNQVYCPGTSLRIVTNMTITDPDDTGIDAIYIQISSGYVIGSDVLTLTGSHPTIATNWNTTTGVLTLTGIAGQPTYIDLVTAIKDIEFSSSLPNPSGVRNFSISVGQANYLPSNGHYYLFIPNIGIRWTAAKAAAETTTYYGLQGYLATITSAEEAQIAGEQTTGAGWIGGSDANAEGTWKWMTGPEAGTIFWNGNFTGSTPSFAFWNNGEPNNFNNEHYAHVTAPGVGIMGSWNDLGDAGDVSGDYQPKGYIVEYGGMPGDPVLHISTSSTITIPSITSTTGATRCGTGTVDLHAVSDTGTVSWYDVPTGGTPIGSGNDFTTPIITATTPFYAAPSYSGCPDFSRTLVTATVTPKPILTHNSPYHMCDQTVTAIDVVTSAGSVFWYQNQTDTTAIFSGTHFTVPDIHQDTIFYVDASFNNCMSNREPVQVNVFSIPNVTDENIILCEGKKIILDAGSPNMAYLWSTGETSQTILSNGLTNYSVQITTPPPGSCSKMKNFNIVYHAQPVISSIDVHDLTITINMVQPGDFEYSLDGFSFQGSNVFVVPQGGSYICYVRERNGCNSDQKPVFVVSYPDFFSPNGDGVNDNWYVKGGNNFSAAQVSIFDRFGKLITVLNSVNPFWDGTLNGKLLPATDYWFVAKINDVFPETKGHFSLIR